MSSNDNQWNLNQLHLGVFEDDVLGDLLRRGALSAQEEFGLKCDGLAGPNTIGAIEGSIGSATSSETPDVPVPARNTSSIEEVYGRFSYTNSTKRPGAIIIDRAWARKNIVRTVFHTGQKTWCHRLIAEELKRLYKTACEESGYTPESIWSFVPRHMRWDNSKPLSRHSWGIAFDIDPKLNGINKRSGTPLHEHPRWVEVFKEAGWSWGGDWSSYCDPMHFERVSG